ncbi:MAG: hypothetical protein QF903_01700 [Planctomycetota bacterium]|jgi:hypothetical protein|nr:hypothetical protein [Planctomycetota bacterium]MDP6764302.1 hypothetical protein [Planctomycetota bacterium]MDP6988178.1 hypothetical protein [Planctomycetota bacterium]
MIRNILAVFVGLAAGMAVNMAIVMVNAYALFPMPEGTSMADTEAMKAYVATLPTAAFLVVIVAHLGQSFVGARVAARIGATRPMLLAMIIGSLTLVAGVINLIQLPGPIWMWIEAPLYLVVAHKAAVMEIRRRGGAGV